MTLTCACGRSSFRVRIDANEQVALLTCDAGHSSLLLDSADYWGDIIQDGRPPERKCRCGGKVWAVSLSYDLREDQKTVRGIEVTLTCEACRTERAPVRFEIDYAPTDALIDRPLTPCTDPWLKAKRVVLTALWTPSDLERFVRHAAQQEGASVFVAGWREAPARWDGVSLAARVDLERVFDVFMTNTEVTFPDNLRDSWKALPVVHVGNPIRMNYTTGTGLLHYVEYAEETFQGPRVTAQPARFLAYARGLRAWLLETYSSARGKNTADNPDEHERLRGGW
jgi:hypothetical protein